MDFQPTKEDLHKIDKAFRIAVMRKKLPIARQALADAVTRKRRLFPKG